MTTIKLVQLKNKGVSVIMFALSAYDGGTLTDRESTSVDIKYGETHLANFTVAGYDSGKRQSSILGSNILIRIHGILKT